MEAFGKIFKELRNERNLTQKEIGKILNISAPAISNWEAGRKLPEVPMLIKIAQFFEVTIDYLLGLQQD